MFSSKLLIILLNRSVHNTWKLGVAGENHKCKSSSQQIDLLQV